MTLGENKKIALALIEEYVKDNEKLTDDTDIQDRINLLYAPAYQELAQSKKIIKTRTLKDIREEPGEGYEEFTLPSSMYQLRKVVAWDKDGNDVATDFKRLGNKIYINRASNAQYILEYYTYPTEITESTPDNFMLEIDQDAQMVLPYQVANDILKVDPSADYTAFMAEYQRKLQALDTRRDIATISVEEGVI